MANDDIEEIIVWRLEQPVPPCTHLYKYRLVFVRAGVRLVGYDNERGKGDHRHFGGMETPYGFIDIATLLADFRRDVEGVK